MSTYYPRFVLSKHITARVTEFSVVIEGVQRLTDLLMKERLRCLNPYLVLEATNIPTSTSTTLSVKESEKEYTEYNGIEWYGETRSHLELCNELIPLPSPQYGRVSVDLIVGESEDSH